MYTEHDDLIDSLKGNLTQVTNLEVKEFLTNYFITFVKPYLHSQTHLDELLDLIKQRPNDWWKRYKYPYKKPEDLPPWTLEQMDSNNVPFECLVMDQSMIKNFFENFNVMDRLELFCRQMTKHKNIHIQINIRKLDEQESQ